MALYSDASPGVARPTEPCVAIIRFGRTMRLAALLHGNVARETRIFWSRRPKLRRARMTQAWRMRPSCWLAHLAPGVRNSVAHARRDRLECMARLAGFTGNVAREPIFRRRRPKLFVDALGRRKLRERLFTDSLPGGLRHSVRAHRVAINRNGWIRQLAMMLRREFLPVKHLDLPGSSCNFLATGVGMAFVKKLALLRHSPCLAHKRGSFGPHTWRGH
jgi:hypothetical protein